MTLSRKGAKSGTRGRKLRSTGTKAGARVVLSREPQAELEESSRRALAIWKKARSRRVDDASLAEALEQQTATSEVLRVIRARRASWSRCSSDAGERDGLCEASFGLMYLCEGDAFASAALHGDLPPAFEDQWRCGTLFRPHPDVAPARAVRDHARSSMLPTLREDGLFRR